MKAIRAYAGAMVLVALSAGCETVDSGKDVPGSGSIDVQVSGEEIATSGILYPTGSEITIADGWDVQFSHVLVTLGNLTLSDNPDKAPSDQSQMGSVIARRAGPWAVDLHREGDVEAAGGEGRAVFLTRFSERDDGEPFDADRRYAFSYEIQAASPDATRVNFADDPEAALLYDEMISTGATVLYVGTATFKGGSECESSDADYDFGNIPTSVAFKLAFVTPVANLNCQNQDNQGDAFEGEEYQRGIPIKKNSASVAQITLHLEHPMFSDLQHDPTLFFDQLAARLVGKAAGATLTMDDLAGVDPTGFVDGNGKPLPWRVCDGSTLRENSQRGFFVGSVPINPSGDPATALRDYRDYVQYVQSTQGHLNGGEGLCFVERGYPSPP